MKQCKILVLIAIAMLLSSCSSVKEGFKNQKKNNSDEFLVEKKSPLIMPPDFDELPIPQEGNINKENENENENEIKKLISKNKEDNTKKGIGEQNKSFENSLLKKIKEN